MSASNDTNGGMAIWPLHTPPHTVPSGNQEFAATRPSGTDRAYEHRAFTIGRTIAMLNLTNAIGELVAGLDATLDDGRGLARARFLAAVQTLWATYDAAINPPSAADRPRARVTEVDFLFDGPPGPDGEAGQFIDTVLTDGSGCAVGEWIEMGDTWALRVRVPDSDVRRS